MNYSEDDKLTIVNEISQLFCIASELGLYHRQPDRFDEKPDFSEHINFTLKKLDELNVPWIVQNNALEYINDCDTSKIWNKLYSNSFIKLAEDLLKKH